MTPSERHAAAAQAKMAERLKESRKREVEYESKLDPRQFQQ